MKHKLWIRNSCNITYPRNMISFRCINVNSLNTGDNQYNYETQTASSHIRSSPFAVSVQTLKSLLWHIFLSLSYSFLLLAGWRLSYCYRCFLPLWESQSFPSYCQNCRIFMTLKNSECFIPKRLLQDTGTQLFKTQKTGTHVIVHAANLESRLAASSLLAN